MTDSDRLKHLQLALRLVGLFAIFCFYPLTVFWSSGWAWAGGRPEYLQMIIGIYAVLGVFLLIAARDPAKHLGLVSFAIWSSLVHGGTMAVQSFGHAEHRGHLYGDVPALLLVTAVLAVLSPEALRLPYSRSS